MRYIMAAFYETLSFPPDKLFLPAELIGWKLSRLGCCKFSASPKHTSGLFLKVLSQISLNIETTYIQSVNNYIIESFNGLGADSKVSGLSWPISNFPQIDAFLKITEILFGCENYFDLPLCV